MSRSDLMHGDVCGRYFMHSYTRPCGTRRISPLCALMQAALCNMHGGTLPSRQWWSARRCRGQSPRPVSIHHAAMQLRAAHHHDRRM